MEAEPEALNELAERCGGLPLALRIIVGLVQSDSQLSLRDLLNELRDGNELFNTFDTGDAGSDVRSVFSWSYRALSPQAAQLFRLLGRYAGPEIARLSFLNLTTVRQDAALMADAAVQAASRLLEDETAAARHILLPPTLVVRQTTGPARSEDVMTA